MRKNRDNIFEMEYTIFRMNSSLKRLNNSPPICNVCPFINDVSNLFFCDHPSVNVNNNSICLTDENVFVETPNNCPIKKYREAEEFMRLCQRISSL